MGVFSRCKPSGGRYEAVGKGGRGAIEYPEDFQARPTIRQNARLSIVIEPPSPPPPIIIVRPQLRRPGRPIVVSHTGSYFSLRTLLLGSIIVMRHPAMSGANEMAPIIGTEPGIRHLPPSILSRSRTIIAYDDREVMRRCSLPTTILRAYVPAYNRRRNCSNFSWNLKKVKRALSYKLPDEMEFPLHSLFLFPRETLVWHYVVESRLYGEPWISFLTSMSRDRDSLYI